MGISVLELMLALSLFIMQVAKFSNYLMNQPEVG